MKYSKIALGLMTILLSGAIAPVATSASSHTTIPKAMRGTWYRYNGKSFNMLKLTTHRFTYKGIDGTTSLTPGQKGYKKLYVQKSMENTHLIVSPMITKILAASKLPRKKSPVTTVRHSFSTRHPGM